VERIGYVDGGPADAWRLAAVAGLGMVALSGMGVLLWRVLRRAD
jgi:hypothetical protein